MCGLWRGSSAYSFIKCPFKMCPVRRILNGRDPWGEAWLKVTWTQKSVLFFLKMVWRQGKVSSPWLPILCSLPAFLFSLAFDFSIENYGLVLKMTPPSLRNFKEPIADVIGKDIWCNTIRSMHGCDGKLSSSLKKVVKFESKRNQSSSASIFFNWMMWFVNGRFCRQYPHQPKD